MPAIIHAVTCKACGKLHPVDDEYLIVTAVVSQHCPSSDFEDKKTKVKITPRQVKVEDVVFCDEECMGKGLSLGDWR